MIITVQSMGPANPALSIHEKNVKLYLGSLMLEMDIDEFKNVMSDIITQAAKKQIYIPTLK